MAALPTGQRVPPPVPGLSKVDTQTKAGQLVFAHLLENFLRQLVDGSTAVPGGFGNKAPSTITANSVPSAGHSKKGWMAADAQLAVSTAAPSSPTGRTPAIGVSPSLLRADCTIQQGIVTTKGDILGYDTGPQRVPVGANTQVLTADSTQALGVKWAAAPSGTAVKATKTLSNNALTNLVDITPIGNPNGQAGGTLRYLIRITDGTHSQSEAGLVNYTQVFSNNVVQAVATKEFSSQPPGMVGTLTVTFAMVGDGAGGGFIQITSNTSFTTTLHEVDYVVEELSAATAVPQ
jgi:hypothetical protein